MASRNGNGKLHSADIAALHVRLNTQKARALKSLKKFRLGDREILFANTLDIGFNLVARIEEHAVMNDMRPADIGRAAGIHTSYRYSWLSTIRRRAYSGRFNPTMIQIIRAAKVTGLTPAELLAPVR